jgi:hypothetical protein
MAYVAAFTTRYHKRYLLSQALSSAKRPFDARNSDMVMREHLGSYMTPFSLQIPQVFAL